jgi:uncharacterized protein (TIGR00369 family)
VSAVEDGPALSAAEQKALEFAERSPETTRTRTVTWQDPVPTAAAGAEMDGLEYMKSITAGDVPPPPIAVSMRFGPIEVSEGRAVFAGQPGEDYYNPIGVVHGGWAATLLDSALGCSVHTTLAKGEAYTSLGLEAKYVRPITRDTSEVRCEAEVVHRGRRQATSEARLYEAETGKLLAHGTTTCMIMQL